MLHAGAKYAVIFCMRVQEYFACGCKIFRNILPAGAKYAGIFACGYKICRNILHVGVKYSACGCKIS